MVRRLVRKTPLAKLMPSLPKLTRQRLSILHTEFPLASPCTGIVHHLSGPNRYARAGVFAVVAGDYALCVRYPLAVVSLLLGLRVISTELAPGQVSPCHAS